LEFEYNAEKPGMETTTWNGYNIRQFSPAKMGIGIEMNFSSWPVENRQAGFIKQLVAA
jgi:hypothetical protein